MLISLNKRDGSSTELQVDDHSLSGVAVVCYNGQNYVFEGYSGALTHVAQFLECEPPLVINDSGHLPETPKPQGRRFFGKPKGQDNG